ncbi:MAG: response regulator transcription factor [Opitutae bacterium]|nr:response regulator transcription factor [Opitutae bacterium]
MNYTFAICSHETLLRQALVGCLERDARARCVAEFSPSMGLDRIPVGTDLLLLDVDGPEEIFLRKLQVIVGARHIRRVLLLTGTTGGYAAHLVWMNNWHGLVHKSDAISAVRESIERVLKGGISLSPNAGVYERIDFSRVLSEREVELLREMARHEDMKLVAHRVGLTAATVRTHRRNIFRKLNLRTQASLVRFALRSGLLSLHAFIARE